MPSDAPAKKDPLGIRYDHAYTDGQGVTHYSRSHPHPARWSSEHDCNPICGCHLSDKCLGCQACTACDGCYCYED